MRVFVCVDLNLMSLLLVLHYYVHYMYSQDLHLTIIHCISNGKMQLRPPLHVALAAVRSVIVDSLLIVTPIVVFCNCSMFCCALLSVHSSFAIISMGKRKLVALLCLSSWCLVIVVWLFLTMPRVCLKFVIVVFPDPTHYFWYICRYEGMVITF